MVNNQLIADAALASTAGPAPKEAPPVKVDNTIRNAWNSYVDWLDKRGLKGHPSLDHDNLSFKMLDEYKKENPDTPLTKELIIPIQQEFSKYRDWAINQIKQGKGQYSPGTDENTFMKGLSIVDGIPGQRTSSFSFPKSYMQTMQDGKPVKIEDTGFATIK